MLASEIDIDTRNHARPSDAPGAKTGLADCLESLLWLPFGYQPQYEAVHAENVRNLVAPH